MIEIPSLYPHQEDLRDRVRASLARNQRVILCAGCGVGKTRTAKAILAASANREPAANQSGRSLFCVYGRNLIDNASDSFSEHPKLPHGVVMSGRPTSYGSRVQVGSLDSLLSWFIEDGKYFSDVTFDLLIADEAHFHNSKVARFLEYHDKRRAELKQHPCYVIGLTATPQGKGLSDVYSEIVMGPRIDYLIANNFLVPFRYYRATQGKLGLLVKRGDEFTKESECLAMDGLAGDLVRDWKRFGDGRVTVGFFPRRSHARDALAKLTESGLRVAYVDGDTHDDDRSSIFRALGNHSLDYLCNVDVVGRGTDIPLVSCIQLAVAIGSVSRYIQYIGRASRTHPNKKDAVIIDHGGSVLRHGFYEDERTWSLDNSTSDPGEQGVRPTSSCPACDRTYRGGKCVCGYEPTPKERRGQGLEFDGSELREVKREEKPESTVKTAEQLMVSAMFRAGRSGKTWSACFAIFKKMCEENGTPTYRVPRTVTIAGQRYKCLRYDSDDKHRRVSHLFPITVSGKHGGDYMVQEQTPAEVQW